MAPWIIGNFPSGYRNFVELMGGAFSVTLRKKRDYSEVYNELNGEITNVFRMVRDRGIELANLISLTPYSYDEFELSYIPTEDPLEQARRTIVRSFMGLVLV